MHTYARAYAHTHAHARLPVIFAVHSVFRPNCLREILRKAARKVELCVQVINVRCILVLMHEQNVVVLSTDIAVLTPSAYINISKQICTS